LRTARLRTLLGLALIAGFLSTASSTRADELTVGVDAVVSGTGGKGLRLRSGPGMGYRVTTVVEDGTSVRILAGPVTDDDDDWYQVGVGGQSAGWGRERYLDPNGSGASDEGQSERGESLARTTDRDKTARAAERRAVDLRHRALRPG
jgi:uncharacterized protein YgiM (DUF1202 family)